MTSYGNFMVAYKPEELNKEPRVSKDVPVNFYEWKEIVDSQPVIVLYLWSNNCRPCLLIRDKFESMAKSLQNEDVVFYKDNIDLPTSFHKEQVEVVPTFFILCDGKEMNHPVHKARFQGWNAGMADAIEFHRTQSKRLQEKQMRRAQSAEPPRLVCKNNVCYIRREPEE